MTATWPRPYGIECKRQDSCLIVTFPVSDMDNPDRVAETGDEIIKALGDSSAVVIDFTGVTAIAPAFFGRVSALRMRLPGKKVCLCGVGPGIQDLGYFSDTGCKNVGMEIFSTEHDAVQNALRSV